MGYQPRSNKVKDEKVDLFTDFHRILGGGGTISLSYGMCLGLMMLGRPKYIQQRH